MKLFKFLIISDDIINEFFTRTYDIETEAKNNNEDMETADDSLKYKINEIRKSLGEIKQNRNRIYYYKDDRSIVLMSFLYPNNVNKNEWAYLLIDKDRVSNVMARGKTQNKGSGVNRSYQKYKWGSRADKKGELVYVNGRSFRIKNGGHVGIRYDARMKVDEEKDKIYKNSDITLRLHEFIYGNGTYKFYATGINRMKERIMHMGHSFDNRRSFLKRVSLAEYRKLHNLEERENGYYRAEKVEVDHYTNEIACDCKCIGMDVDNIGWCKRCCGVLKIETEKQLKFFISEILSDKYKELSNYEV